MADAFPYIPTPDPQANPLPGYGDVFGAQPAIATAPQMGYASAMQPEPHQAVQQMYKPTNDPQEIQQRTEGWQQVLQRVTSDPNLMRAIGYAGSAMSQPIPRGQSVSGHIGNAFAIGRSAYDFGKEAEFSRQLATAKEGREQAESTAKIGLQNAQTESTQVNTEGQRTQNEIANATKEDAINKVKVEYQKAQQDLEKAKNDNEKAKIQMDWEKRVAAIKKSIPDALIQQDFENDLKKSGIEIQLRKAQIGEAGAKAAEATAGAREKTAKAVYEETQNTDLAGMSVAERQSARNKRAAGTNISGQVQYLDAFKANWRAAHPGASEQEVATAADKMMTTAKEKGENRDFLDWAALYGKGDYAKDKAAYEAANASKAPTGASTQVPGPGSGRGTPVVKPPAIGEIREKNGIKAKYKGGPLGAGDPSSWEVLK